MSTPTWFHSGIRHVLHHRAPEALNPALEILDLGVEFPDGRDWVRNHLAATAFGPRFTGLLRPGALTFIRRASHALAHYIRAREQTLRFASWDGKGPIPAGDFFAAIEEWENCVLHHQMLVTIFNKLLVPPGSTLFTKGDGTATERLYGMANDVKHSMGSTISEQDLTPLWLEKEGIATLGGYHASYQEVAEDIRDACLFARSLVDPAKFKESLAAPAGEVEGSDQPDR